MRLVFLTILAVMVSFSVHAESEMPSEASLEFAEKFSKQHFNNLVQKVIRKTETYKMIITKKPINGEKILAEQTKIVVEKYYPEWKKNSALSWQKLLSDQEMQSLLAEENHSPYFNKMVKSQTQVGAEMKKRSEPLLVKASSEVLEKAFEITSKKQ